ncbi:MAG: DUF559 domain-containing protein [Devosia sp.]
MVPPPRWEGDARLHRLSGAHPSPPGRGDQPKAGGWGLGLGVERARALRKSMSPAEARMWSMLRTEFKALHFRRQMPIGPYYVDFVSVKARLVIEVDGSQHTEDVAVAYDARRTLAIEALGYRVVRFATTDVLHHLDGVHAVLLDAVERRK